MWTGFRFEPRAALDGGPDGLDAIRGLLRGLPGAMNHDGVAFLEMGADQGEAVLEAARTLLPGWTADVLPDLGGSPRVVRLAPPVTAPAQPA
jgi:release factor glutamine methyltransferase